MTTAREENGEFCVVAPAPGLLVYWPSWLKALAVKLSRPSGRSGSYTGLIGFNPRWLQGPKRGMSSHATDLSVCAKSSSSSSIWKTWCEKRRSIFKWKMSHFSHQRSLATDLTSVVVKTFLRSRDQDKDLDKMNSSALKSRDHGLEITSLAASVLIGDRALA